MICLLRIKEKYQPRTTYLDVELRDLIYGNSTDFNFVKLYSKIQTKTIELYEQKKMKKPKSNNIELQISFQQ